VRESLLQRVDALEASLAAIRITHVAPSRRFAEMP
jgi:hypothetical protein